MGASNWQKFRLLMWKNWLIQWSHKVQTVVEILMPVLCTAVLVILRSLVEVREFPNSFQFAPVEINSLAPLRTNITIGTIVDWRIAYSPQNPVLDELVARVSRALMLQGHAGTATAADLERSLLMTPFLCGIEFEEQWNYTTLPVHLRYALRFPGELRTSMGDPTMFNWQTDKFEPVRRQRGPRSRLNDDGGMPPGYAREGFLAVQHAIADQFLRLHSSDEAKMPAKAQIQRFPYPPFRLDHLLDVLDQLVALIILLSFIYPVINTVRVIGTEKERQLKEAMQIMGMPGWLHWVGWFVRSMIYWLVSVSLVVMMLKVHWTQQPVAVMTYTDWSVLWVYLAVYSMSAVTFCFMMSVFFAKANVAAAVTGLVWFALYLIYIFVQPDSMEVWQMLLLSALFSNTGMAFGFLIMLRFEGTSEGTQWSNLFKPQSIDNDLTVGHVMLALLLSALIYLLIALYVEQIRPGDYGVPQPWYYPVTRSYWFGTKRWSESANSAETDADDTIDRANFEDIQTVESEKTDRSARRAGIQIRKLRKKFGSATAVHRLSLDMYEDQITVLLGHNGAGKTTTMSMLTGMLPPSSGTALVNGYDIREDIASVRGSVGLCPQHNILFDDLTVAEHIEFYARLKGVSGKEEVAAEVKRYVDLIQLSPKGYTPSRALSGGMKRKLSVCIAFCGGSQVVFCDEPSSGMDPAARRALWEVFLVEKRGRTVLLSTHFMDEADVLGDRIAIMNAGNLVCCGTSYFLKKRFGAGYHLVCAKESHSTSVEMDALGNVLRKYDPAVRMEWDSRTEVSFVLAEASTERFAELFAELEKRSGELGLRSFGVSLTTLEEVFLKVGSDAGAAAELAASTSEQDIIEMTSANRTKSLGSLESMSTVLESGSEISFDHFENSNLLTGWRLYRTQTVALFKKRYIQTLRSWLLFLAQLLIPMLFAVITIVTDRSNRRSFDLPRLGLQLTMFRESEALQQLDLLAPPESWHRRFADSYTQVALDSHPNGRILSPNEDLQQFILRLSKNNLPLVNRAYFVGVTTMTEDEITVWFNNQPYHAVPIALNMVHEAVLRTHLGPHFTIDVTNAPLPYDDTTRIQQVTMGGQLGFALALNIAYAMAFVMAFYVLPFVREQANRAKLLQFVSGAKVLIYWTTAFIYDYFTYVLTCAVMLIAFAAFQETGWSTALELGQIALVLATFGFAALPVTYVAARMFTVPTAGYTLLTIVYIITGLLFATLVTSLTTFGFRESAEAMTWVFMLLPHFALSMCLRRMQVVTQTEQVCRLQCERLPLCTEANMCAMWPDCCGHTLFSFEEQGIATPLFYMLGIGLIAIGLNFVLEYRVIQSVLFLCRNRYSRNAPIPPSRVAQPDADVQNERDRVHNMSEFEIRGMSLVAKDVSKMYGQFCSVNRLALAVDGGECFGLLGVNGAGKTTTFRMLTGDLPITEGEAWVRGISLRTHMHRVHRHIGYCPQFEALVDEMTCRETLELFGRLRGVPSTQIAGLTAALAGELHFTRHLDKQVRQCSGGNRRKVSTAVALIGAPAVVYLDEPSAGMDPGAKRHLWNAVNRMRAAGTSVVLTSHSMDECEALCTRLAIMVNGEFQCVGSVQHLKSKFSTGYTLVVQLRRRSGLEEGAVTLDVVRGLEEQEAEDAAVKRFLGESFAESVLQSDTHGLLTYYIPSVAGQQLALSTMFGRLQLGKRQCPAIEDYTLSQTTLEQVFLTFANKQFQENQGTSGA